jgi:hypothetical protein
MASTSRGEDEATKIATAPAQTERTSSHSIDPSGMIKTPDAPNLVAASQASDRIGSGAVALETRLGVTACGLDRMTSFETRSTQERRREG